MLVFAPFRKQVHWNTERISNSLKVTQLIISNRARNHTQVVSISLTTLLHCLSVSESISLNNGTLDVKVHSPGRVKQIPNKRDRNIHFCHICMHAKSLQSCLTLWDPMDRSLPVSLSMGFCRQEYWSWLPCPPPGDLPDLGIEPMPLMSPALDRRVLYH